MKHIIQEIEWALKKYLQQEKDWRVSADQYAIGAQQDSVYQSHYKETAVKQKAKSEAARAKHDLLQEELIELKVMLNERD